MENNVVELKTAQSYKKLSPILFNIMTNALVNDDEIDEKGALKISAIIAKGVGKGYAFNPERLKEHRKEVIKVITQMDERFFKGVNGNQNGGLVILLKRTQSGKFWTKGDVDLEHLICLSIALNLGDFCQKREEWLEMPYFVFNGTREHFINELQS